MAKKTERDRNTRKLLSHLAGEQTHLRRYDREGQFASERHRSKPGKAEKGIQLSNYILPWEGGLLRKALETNGVVLQLIEVPGKYKLNCLGTGGLKKIGVWSRTDRRGEWYPKGRDRTREGRGEASKLNP